MLGRVSTRLVNGSVREPLPPGVSILANSQRLQSHFPAGGLTSGLLLGKLPRPSQVPCALRFNRPFALTTDPTFILL